MNNNVTLEDLNVLRTKRLITPSQLKDQIPMTDNVMRTVRKGRRTIKNIIDRTDHRLFLVVGPCSIHDTEAALDYARRLQMLAEKVSDTLYLVMRVYFEKPRTTVGWKGLINDPYLNSSFNIVEGLKVSRKLLTDLAEMGMATATEALDPISPQFLQDLISWSAIGARTTESQTHREMASGLSSAVGFKNGTDGCLTVAMNALGAASEPHRFLGINHDGEVSFIHTLGNKHAHIVLRGSNKGTNYDAGSVAECETALAEGNYPANIMIDCSHANSENDHNRQKQVMENVSVQIVEGNNSIVGLMIESNIGAGKQKVPENFADLKYGVSITDACVDWETTETMVRDMHNQLKTILPKRLPQINERVA